MTKRILFSIKSKFAFAGAFDIIINAPLSSLGASSEGIYLNSIGSEAKTSNAKIITAGRRNIRMFNARLYLLVNPVNTESTVRSKRFG